MKSTLRKSILAGIVALATVGAAIPAHATVSGSAPRPTVVSTSSMIIPAILAVFGF
jgi:preprotein translocase subunit SecD